MQLLCMAAPLYGESARLRDARYAHIDFGYFVPCRVVYDSCGGETEDALESAYCIGCGGSKDAVFDNARYGRIVLGDAV